MAIPFSEATGAEPTCVTTHQSAETTPRQLTVLGLQCFEARRFDWALTHYLAAFENQPEPVLLGAIGRSLHELGLYGPALEQYRAFIAAEGQDSPGSQRIQQRIQDLKDQESADSATLQLRSDPVGARAILVLENGAQYPLGLAPLEVSLRDGEYEIRVEADGYHPMTREVRLQGGEVHQARADLVTTDAAFMVSQRRWRQAGGWTMASSVPITAAGITLLVLGNQNTQAARDLEDSFPGLSDYDARRREHLDRAADYRLWGTIGTAVGATGFLTGAMLLSAGYTRSQASDDDEGSGAPAARVLQPIIGVNYAGLQLRF